MSIDYRKPQSTSFHIDMTEVYKILETLQDTPVQAKAIFNSAIAKTKPKVSRTIAEHVAGRYAVDKAAIGRFGKGSLATVIWKTNQNDMTATIQFTGRRLTLAHFPYAPASRPSSRKYRVFAAIKQGHLRTLNKRTFIASTGATGAGKVQSLPFMRTGEWGKPDPTRNAKSFRLKGHVGQIEKIRPFYTLSVPQMVSNQHLHEPIERDIGQILMKTFTTEAGKMLARNKGV